MTPSATAVDFAFAMRRPVDERYPEVKRVRVVLDDLNTHTGAALYQAFEPEEAHLTPVGVSLHALAHASWLNMAETELSVLSQQCLERRIPDAERLRREIGAWEQQRRRADGAVALHSVGRSGKAGTPLPGTTVVVEY